MSLNMCRKSFYIPCLRAGFRGFKILNAISRMISRGMAHVSVNWRGNLSVLTVRA